LLVNQSLLQNNEFTKVALGLLEAGVTLKCEQDVLDFLMKSSNIPEEYKQSKLEKATEEDFFTEFLDLIIAVKSVADVDAAVVHIN